MDNKEFKCPSCGVALVLADELELAKPAEATNQANAEVAVTEAQPNPSPEAPEAPEATPAEAAPEVPSTEVAGA